MDLKFQGNALRLILQILERKGTQPCIDYVPKKPAFESMSACSEKLLRSSPEKEGVESALLLRFLSELCETPSVVPHSLLIARNGKVICEGSFAPYRSELWHVTHSLCKSITALAIGMLVDEGKLSLVEKLRDLFAEEASALTQIFSRNLSVRHLLTMSSGASFNEAGSVTEEDWVHAFLDSTPRFEPGTEFSYNSMNTYMLSAIVKKKTGESLSEYLKPRLFSPLGIGSFYWETCPKGIEKGGWGLYLLPEDMLKIGILYAQEGAYNGKQLVSREWIREATKKQMEVPEKIGKYDYGYQVWVGKTGIHLNGMFGQNVSVLKNGITVAMTAGNSDLFQSNAYFGLIERYFGTYVPKEKLPETPGILRKLRERSETLELRYAGILPRESRRFGRSGEARRCALLSGKSFSVQEPFDAGLLPLLVQSSQNQFTTGTQSFSFSFEQKQFFVSIQEKGSLFRLPVGFQHAKETTLAFGKEHYTVAVLGDFAENEDHIPVLKLTISFLELPNVRTMKFFFYPDAVRVRWEESPGADFLVRSFPVLMDSIRGKRLLGLIASKLNSDLVVYKLRDIFSPEAVFKA